MWDLLLRLHGRYRRLTWFFRVADVYVLGLCEGNHCRGGSEGRDRGNGRIVVLKEINDEDGEGDKCKCGLASTTLGPFPNMTCDTSLHQSLSTWESM
jgi:hypothetical protein